MCRPEVDQVVRALARLGEEQGRSYGPDVDVLDVVGDDASVMVLYRHRHAPGVFGFRQVVVGQTDGAPTDGAPTDGAPTADDLATQIWYAEVEPVPDVTATQAVDGVQWWGDPPFPVLPPPG